ncbi:hypothetical protein [Streptomyces sp. CS090A]|uniref:hypothetical protein n=1 Tax=Streptomyces sp. CS090A TaxID=2162710 RepID=UPI0013A57486|nr:hypothetical protein [Streptomyces sp. CS090A]
MDEDEPTVDMMLATCRTPGCLMEGVGQVAPFTAYPTPPTYRGWCAECGKPHTDIVPAP